MPAISKNLSDLRCLIITHRLYTGAGQDLYRFLKGIGAETVLIEHSFLSYPDRRTTVTSFRGGRETIRDGLDFSFLPDSLVYAKDFCASLAGGLRQGGKFDLAIGCGGFNALAALGLRRAGRAKKAIFYTIDFAPRRFENTALNRLYHKIDYLCVRRCDRTWNVSPRIAPGRERFNPSFHQMRERQRVVPIGVWLEEPPETPRKYNRPTAVFIGHLTAQQGLQSVLPAVGPVRKEIPGFRLLVIGSGGYGSELKKIRGRLGLNEAVSFLGAITDPDRLSGIMRKSHLGLAVYEEPAEEDTAYYADSTKIKTYLAMGLPVLLSGVPHNAREIEIHGCGTVVDPDPESVRAGIVKLLRGRAEPGDRPSPCREYIRNFAWERIFSSALSDLVEP
jgi:glycosyltransferase involved in cell wall biosynthesis